MKYQLVSGEEFNEIKEVLDANHIIFTDEVAPKGVKVTDLSKDRDGSVVGWMEDDGVYKVSTQAEGQKAFFNEECAFMFSDCKNLKAIDFNFIDTSKVENMGYMFDGCKNLGELDLSGFDTSKVDTMTGMFKDCEKLKKLDLHKLDTSHVTNMWGMFYNCENLKEINLSHFDTSNVTNMSEMFTCCTSLKELNLVSFNTSNVINMMQMFFYCDHLEKLNVSSFNTSNVQYMQEMFAGCSKLKKIRLGAFTTSKDTDMTFMFGKCTSLKKVYTTNEKFYSRYVLYPGGLLQDCRKMNLGDIQNGILQLQWNDQALNYQSNLPLKETIHYFEGYIGYVYPLKEEPYYICSGGNNKLSVVCCSDGEFYGDSNACESLCIGDYVLSKPSQDVIEIAEELEKRLLQD